MTELAEALLEAHVAHELAKYRGPDLDARIESATRAVFEWLEDASLEDLVSREQILGVIDRYAIELKVSGGITELAGQMANVVFSSPASRETRIRDICSPRAFAEFADKVVALEGVRRELVADALRSPSFRTIGARVASTIAVDLALGNGEDAPGLVGKILGSVGRRLVPGLEGRLVRALTRFAEAHADRLSRGSEEHLLAALDPEWVRQIADELWDLVSGAPVSDVGAFFSAQDLEDFVVLGFEFWLEFRKTPYFRAVSTAVVDELLRKYGKESVSALIVDMGVTEEMVAHEIRTFLEPALAHADRTGFLEQRIRAWLEPFYRSPAAQDVLGR